MNHKGFHFLTWAVPLSTLVAFILLSILSRAHLTELTRDAITIDVEINLRAETHPYIYYTSTDQFYTDFKVKAKVVSDGILRFKIPRQKNALTKIRLDFGDTPISKDLVINSMHIQSGKIDKKLNEEEVFDALFLHSPSVDIDHKNRRIRIVKGGVPFDPYVIFNSIGILSLPEWSMVAGLLLPFVLVLIIFLVKYIDWTRVPLENWLVMLFIICIPLKIAWTTFTAILLASFGVLLVLLKRRSLSMNLMSILFMGTLLVMLLIGNPGSYKAVSTELALAIMAIIGMTLHLGRTANKTILSVSMLFLFGVLAATAGTFIYWFPDLYGLSRNFYFEDVKIYNGIVRDWLYFNHAAFLSFFGVLVLPFVWELTKNITSGNLYRCSYCLLLLGFIVFSGSRVNIITFCLVLLNLLVNWRWQLRIFFNFAILAIYVAAVWILLPTLDPIRSNLWEHTLAAIQVNPWMGYGLDSSAWILMEADIESGANKSLISGLNHSHNQLLTFILELGLVGALILIAFSILIVVRGGFYRNKAFISGLFALFIMCVTESILQTSKPLYVLSFIFLMLSEGVYTKTYRNITVDRQ